MNTNPSPRHTADGTLLPTDWRTNLPVRWVLNPDKPHHCDACLSYAGEYPNWETMLQKTNGAEPGFFPACARPTDMTNATQLIACWDACQCSVEIIFNGDWKHLM